MFPWSLVCEGTYQAQNSILSTMTIMMNYILTTYYDLDAGLCVHDEQELPGQDGTQGGADLSGIPVHGGCLGPDGLRHRPQGLPHVTTLKPQSS